jgi:hypothetical protein
MSGHGYINGTSGFGLTRRRACLGSVACVPLLMAAALASPVVNAGVVGASTPVAARLTADQVGAALTDPTGGGHSYRHGAVPRKKRVGSVGQAGQVSTKDLRYGGGLTAGGLVNAGVTTGQPQVFLVFYGGQWGTEGTNGAGEATFTHDPRGLAPALQTLYAGLGTKSEQWSGIVTQYCDGVAVGATSCTASGQRIPYPTGDLLAGVWYDASSAATSGAAAGATGHQLAAEAEAAAGHFGHTDQASNRDTQYVIVSPTGSNADGWSDPNTGYCAYHDDTHDPTIDGGGPAPGPILAFTNLPYVPDAGASCGAGSVNNPGVLDGATEAASHEYAETLTDQFPESAPPGGWSNTSGAEIGDLCAYIAAPQPGAAYNLVLSTGTVAVQGLWSNAANSGNGGCVQGAPVAQFSPSIASIAPTVAAVGQQVTIGGANLSGATKVAFHGTAATVVSDSDSAVTALVPPGLTSGPISVTTAGGTATSTQSFTVAVPLVKKFTAGAVGQQVTISGANLSGATKVTFNGTPAFFFSDTLTSVAAVVPAGTNTGPVTVQTPGGIATSARSFSPVPTITSFTPASGPVGTSVTVTGTGLGGAKRVKFTSRRAVIASDTPTQIVVVVPRRASTGPISVETAGGTGVSSSSFTVT